MSDTRHHVHELIDQLPPKQLDAVAGLLEAMLDDEFDEEDRRAIAASREYLRNGGEGIPFEKVVADLGFTMEQVRNFKRD